MSADNGIYILVTKGPEFRVVHAQGIDNIYGDFDDTTSRWKGDPEMIREYFNSSQKYDTIEESLDIATEMSYDYSFLEDGICVIREFEDLVFTDL